MGVGNVVKQLIKVNDGKCYSEIWNNSLSLRHNQYRK